MKRFGEAPTAYLRRAARLAIRGIPSNAIVPILTGPLRSARWVAGSCNPGCWMGRYERSNQLFISRELEPGAFFVDIGAHVGFFTLLGSRLVGKHGKVAAFEPLPRNLELLNKHLQLNRARNVTVFPFALANRRGRARFGFSVSPSCASLHQDGSEEVEVRTLDETLASFGGGDVRLIKMDVEGAEAAVVQGAVGTLARRPRPALIIATHGWEAHARTVEGLSELGFQNLRLEMDDDSGNGLIRYSSRA